MVTVEIVKDVLAYAVVAAAMVYVIYFLANLARKSSTSPRSRRVQRGTKQVPQRPMNVREREERRRAQDPLGIQLAKFWLRVKTWPARKASELRHSLNSRHRRAETNYQSVRYQTRQTMTGEGGRIVADPVAFGRVLAGCLPASTSRVVLDKEEDDGTISDDGSNWATFVANAAGCLVAAQDSKFQDIVPSIYWVYDPAELRYVLEVEVLPPQDSGDQDDDDDAPELDIELHPASREGSEQITDSADDATTEVQAPVPNTIDTFEPHDDRATAADRWVAIRTHVAATVPNLELEDIEHFDDGELIECLRAQLVAVNKESAKALEENKSLRQQLEARDAILKLDQARAKTEPAVDIKAQAEQATEPDPTPPDDIDIKIETDGEEPNLADDFATESESSEDLSDDSIDWGNDAAADADDEKDDDDGEEETEEVDAMGWKQKPSAADSTTAPATVEEPLAGFFDPSYFEVNDDGSPRIWPVMVWNHDNNGQPQLVIIYYGAYTDDAPKMEDGGYTFLLEPSIGSSNFDANNLSVIRDRDGYPAFRINGVEPRLGTQYVMTIWEGVDENGKDRVIYKAPITLPSVKNFEAWAKEHPKPEPQLFYVDKQYVDVEKMKQRRIPSDPESKDGRVFAMECYGEDGQTGAIVFCPSWKTDAVPTGDDAVLYVRWIAEPINEGAAAAVETIPSKSKLDGTPCVRIFASKGDFVAGCAGKRYLVSAILDGKTILRVPLYMPRPEQYQDSATNNGNNRNGAVAVSRDRIVWSSGPEGPKTIGDVAPIRADDEMMASATSGGKAEDTKAAGDGGKAEVKAQQKTPAEIAAEKAAEAKKAKAEAANKSKKQQDAGENLGELLTESVSADSADTDDTAKPQTKDEKASGKIVYSSKPEEDGELTESQMVLALNGAVQSSEGDKPKEDEDTDEKLARARKRELEKRDDSSRQPNRGKRSSKRRRH